MHKPPIENAATVVGSAAQAGRPVEACFYRSAGGAEIAGKVMEAARKAWNLPKGTPFGSPEEFYAKMEEFSALMGFVSSAKYDELRKENEKLKKENDLLKDMVRELQNNLYKEGAEMARQSWQNLIEKQLEVNKDLAKSFFDQFKDSGKNK